MHMARGKPFHSASSSPGETAGIGHALGKLLKPGDVIYIYGDVGAGKTVFVGGVASALNIEERITSPTYAIMNMYSGDMPLCHYDAYRIKSPAELFEAGFFEFSGGRYVAAVEWAENIDALKPCGCIEVRIGNAGGSETSRVIDIKFDMQADEDTGY